jgi:hypothetical protein
MQMIFAAVHAPGWVPIISIIYLLIWFFLMVAVLTRDDLDPITRLTWVLVVGFLPVAGIILYFIASPREPKWKDAPARPLSSAPEDNLKGTPWEQHPGFTKSK